MAPPDSDTLIRTSKSYTYSYTCFVGILATVRARVPHLPEDTSLTTTRTYYRGCGYLRQAQSPPGNHATLTANSSQPCQVGLGDGWTVKYEVGTFVCTLSTYM